MRLPAADTARGRHCPRPGGAPPQSMPPGRGFPAGGVCKADRMSSEEGTRTKLAHLRDGCSPSRRPQVFASVCVAQCAICRLVAMKGRPPTPKHILALRGSKHAKNREELGAAPAAPITAPEWLKPRAQEIFGRVVAWLEGMGTLA